MLTVASASSGGVQTEPLAGVVSSGNVSEALAETRRVQPEWAAVPLRQRLRVLRRLRLLMAENAAVLAAGAGRAATAETLSAEVLPLLDAIRYLERCAVRVLRERRVRRAGRPLWLWGTRIISRPEPLGVVLVIGPANYPLFLPGVQLLQALAAGNGVLIKPAPECAGPMRQLLTLALEAGLPVGLVQVLEDTVSSGLEAIRCGVDKVLLTGSASTGRLVAERLAGVPTPCVMELSGCDAVFVLADADPELVADCLWFGLRLNGSRTCLAPRRVFVRAEQADSLLECLRTRMDVAQRRGGVTVTAQWPADVLVRVRRVVTEALQQGAVLRSGRLPEVNEKPIVETPILLDFVRPEMAVVREDLFFPVLSVLRVRDDEDALRQSAECPYALAATVFGSPRNALRIAGRVDAGTVVLNDMIVATADPRVSFEGRHASGFGATRGAEGLLQLVQIKQIIRTRPFFRPHLEDPGPCDAELLEKLIRVEHASWLGQRLWRLPGLIRAAWQQWKWRQKQC